MTLFLTKKGQRGKAPTKLQLWGVLAVVVLTLLSWLVDAMGFVTAGWVVLGMAVAVAILICYVSCRGAIRERQEAKRNEEVC